MSEEKDKKEKKENINRTPGHFSNEEIKEFSFGIARTKCPKCRIYPAQVDFDGTTRPCLKCEGDELEKDFIF